MIQNAEYQDIIDKINRIRSYGLNKMITIPQIAILGDQSSGKSSVLEAITKLSFLCRIDRPSIDLPLIFLVSED